MEALPIAEVANFFELFPHTNALIELVSDDKSK